MEPGLNQQFACKLLTNCVSCNKLFIASSQQIVFFSW